MLKLIKCEFLKLKRKKFIPLIILAAFLFPIPLTYLMITPSMMERYTDRADAFDGLFNMVLGYGIQFLLPCIIGVIAAILFFMERDNDTFKNFAYNSSNQHANGTCKDHCPFYLWNCFLSWLLLLSTILCRNWNIRSLWNWL